jgi:hypothetical protein
MRDLTPWATGAARLLRSSGHLFIYESHPAVALWTWGQDVAAYELIATTSVAAP